MNTKEKINALIEAGKTQQWIADHTVVRQATVSRILQGKHKRVYSDTADSINALYEEVVIPQQASSG